MKEEQNEFERLLKEKADRFEMKPSPEVWQDVQSAIQQSRRRPFAWWWMAAALFAVVLGTGTFFMFENKSHQPATSSAGENNSDGSNSVANNSSSEKSNTEKNPTAISSDTTPLSQNQTADNSPLKNEEEKISKGKSQNENHSVPINGDLESRSIGVLSERTPSEKQVPEQILPINRGAGGTDQHDADDGDENISLLSSKQLPLTFSEASLHELPFKSTSIDFSSASSSKHSFYFEADAMPLASFVWNHTTVSPIRISFSNSTFPENNSSYTFTKGFSAGGNFFLEQNKKWLLGAGVHLTKTHLEAITAQQSFPVYDTSYVFDGNTFLMEVAQTGDTIVYQSQSDVNQWLDVSLMTGVKLFPSSKNHVRILAGAGYSRLVADKNSHTITPETYYDALSNAGGGAYDTTGLMTTPVYSYQKNQVQLFSEISYQRDITSRLSFTTGMQLHYYPMNLMDSEDITQRMMWIGLKGGFLFRL